MTVTTLVVPDAGDDAHALLSASSASRWGVCPISVAASGERKSSRAAAEGTLAHYISENVLRGLPAPLIGTPAVCESHEFEVTEDFMRDATAYVDYVRSRPWHGGYSVEVQANYSRSLSVPYAQAWGTSDCSGFEQNPMAPRGTMLHVIDLKFGRNPVSPVQNKQMACYAAGVLDGLYPYMLLPGDTWVQLTIFQPRLSHRPFSWLTTGAWIEATMQALRQPAAAAVAYYTAHEFNSAPAREVAAAFPEVTGEHCQYCPRARECTALNAKLKNVGLTANTAAPLVWDAELFGMRKVITQHLEELEKLALDSAVAGTVLPGTKLVSGRAGNPALRLAEPELKGVLTKYGVLDKVYRLAPQWDTPAKIRDALKAANCPAEELATVVKAGDKKPAIADASDPREAYAPPGLAMFTATVRPS